MGRKSRSKKDRPAEPLRAERSDKSAFAANAGAGISREPSSPNRWLFAIALVTAVFLTYQPAWHGDFVWDDDLHLLNNPVLQAGGLARAWTHFGDYVINYWPLTFTVYRFEFDVWGLHPLGFHLVNIGLHAVTALLVWRVLVELRVPGAMMAAAIFALHPVNVESVAWIAQLKGVLSLLFAVISTLFYLKYDRRGGWGLYAAALIAFGLSTLAKGMVLTLPVVLLACVWWRRGAIQRRDLVRVVPYLLIGAVMAGVEIWSQQDVRGVDVVRSDSLVSRTAVAGRAVWFYFGKLLWPFELCVIYPRWKVDDRDALRYVPALLLISLFALALWRRRSWGRPVVMLIVCYVGLLLPALGFANVYFMRYSLVADHWQYAAMIVPCAMLTGAAAAWTFRQPGRRRLAAYIAGGLLLALFVVQSREQSRVYANLQTLWDDTLAKNPDCWMAFNNRAGLYMKEGRNDLALADLSRAIELKTDHREARDNRGVILIKLGRSREALNDFNRAIELNPGIAQTYRNRGEAYQRMANFQEANGDRAGAMELLKKAIDDYTLAIAKNASDPEYFVNRGDAWRQLGQLQKAIDDFNAALKLDPHLVGAFYNRGLAYHYLNQLDLAVQDYSWAIQYKSDYWEAYDNRGSAYLQLKQHQQALDDFNRAIAIKPDAGGVYVHRALLYFERRDCAQAWSDVKRGRELGSQPSADLINNLTKTCGEP
jgi:protein O-mannosyl-transferase